jgi:hypothetical protein
LVLLYFLCDVLFILAAIFLGRRLRFGGTAREFLWDEAPEIVSVWFFFHLTQLCFNYVIAERLEAIGLGGLEYLVFLGFLICGAGCLFRTLRNEN